MKRILTGIKPTGDGMHLGNYLGMFLPFLKQAQTNEAFLFIADYHALTSVHNGDTLRKNKHRLAAELLSLMPKETNFYIFEQSKIPHINDMTWILSSVTPYSLLLRAHSFKDAQNKNSDINMAVFNYPVLMSADIIGYDVDLVPVGKDQTQHLEFTRDIAGYFNKNYGSDFFKLPEAYIKEELATIPGVDGRKMSKSYGNFLWVFDDEKTLKKNIMSIVTDTTPLELPKNPDTCNVFTLLGYLAPKEKQEKIRQNYLQGNYGYGHAKQELYESFLEYFWEARARYQAYIDDYSLVEEALHIWNTYAASIHTKKYQELLKITGLSL